MADYGHTKTEQQFAELESRISAIYKTAAGELKKKIDDYFSAFAERDKQYRKRVDAGEMTEEKYKQWRLAQIGRGARFEKLRDEMAERYTKANETAVAYVNDTTPSIYSLNRNYAAYTIEQVAGNVGFTLWDEQTVKRLIVEEPNLMPYYPEKRALKRGIDLDWGKKQITAQVTSGILQGEGIGKISDRLQTNIPEMNRTSAIRTARTAVTGAQNSGRMDAYTQAEKMGIEMEREWVATLDNRTRHAHQILDGKRAPIDKPFKVDGQEIMFPGDAKAAPYLVYNCRCTLVAVFKNLDIFDVKRRTGKEVIDNISYREWEQTKKTATIAQEKTVTQKKNILDTEVTIAKAKAFASSHEYDKVKSLQEVRTITNGKLGYDGLPVVLPRDEFEKFAEGKTRLYRGVVANGDKSAGTIANEFKHGELWTGNTGGAVYGNGVYFTDIKEDAERDYAGVDGAIIEAVLSDDAKIADYISIASEYQRSGMLSFKAEKEMYEYIIGDVGQYAAMAGYDAIALNGFSGHNYIILLNRTMAIVKE